MADIEDYVARIEETCGEEKHFIVFLRYEKRDEALAKVLKRAVIEKSISSIIFEIKFNGFSARVYASGKLLFKGLKDKSLLLNVLSALLL